jgi:hypothetical protein
VEWTLLLARGCTPRAGLVYFQGRLRVNLKQLIAIDFNLQNSIDKLTTQTEKTQFDLPALPVGFAKTQRHSAKKTDSFLLTLGGAQY